MSGQRQIQENSDQTGQVGLLDYNNSLVGKTGSKGDNSVAFSIENSQAISIRNSVMAAMAQTQVYDEQMARMSTVYKERMIKKAEFEEKFNNFLGKMTEFKVCIDECRKAANEFDQINEEYTEYSLKLLGHPSSDKYLNGNALFRMMETMETKVGLTSSEKEIINLARTFVLPNQKVPFAHATMELVVEDDEKDDMKDSE